MEGTQLILHFEGSVGFLTPARKISLKDLGLSGMLTRFKQPAYWVLKVIRASLSTGKLFVDVLSYHPGFRTVSDAQLHDAELVQYSTINFKNLDTSGVYASSNGTGAGTSGYALKPMLPEAKAADEAIVPLVVTPVDPIRCSFPESFTIGFEEATFLNGKVQFEVASKIINKTLSLAIPNEHLLAEYDYIKSWFPKRLDKPAFTVSATIEILDGVVVSCQCTSPEIARITPELIAAIRLQRVIGLSSVPKIQSNKSLFTLDEAFKEVIAGDVAGNLFHQQDAEVLKQLINDSNIRNKRELQYLSGKLHSAEHPLRYTLAPQFGFLFCVEGLSANHFIWELLNSHATYLWTLERNTPSTDSQFQLIDQEISIIKAKGRQEYRSENRAAIDPAFPFRAIHHKARDSDSDNSFLQWKEELEKHLV